MYSEKPKLHERQKSHKPGMLRSIALDVTSKCNMKCSHCYAETFVNVKPIDLDILGKALEEAYQMGVFHYVLQGGEALVEPDRLEAIINMSHPDETYYTLVSNGWAMTREKVEWLKSIKIDKICYSMDSGIPEEHDANRCKGAFERVLKAIDYTLEAGLICSISTVITHQSVHSEGFKKIREIADQKGVRVDIQIAEPVGKWDGKKEFLVTPEDAAHIKKLYLETPPLPGGMKRFQRDIFTGGGEDHCPAGTEFIGITADGQVLPCNFLQFSLGNIRDKSLRQMRDDLLTSDWFSGEHNCCICGEDHEFIDNFIMPYVDRPKPLDAYEVFKLKTKGDK